MKSILFISQIEEGSNESRRKFFLLSWSKQTSVLFHCESHYDNRPRKESFSITLTNLLLHDLAIDWLYYKLVQEIYDFPLIFHLSNQLLAHHRCLFVAHETATFNQRQMNTVSERDGTPRSFSATGCENMEHGTNRNFLRYIYAGQLGKPGNTGLEFG